MDVYGNNRVMKPGSKRVKDLEKRFFDWLESKGCETRVSSNAVTKTVEVLQMKDGKPWMTVCYETFAKKLSDGKCLSGVVERLVTDTLQAGFFDRIGISGVKSYEELDLKLSVFGG